MKMNFRRLFIILLCIFSVIVFWGYVFPYKIDILFDYEAEQVEMEGLLDDLDIRLERCMESRIVDELGKTSKKIYLCMGDVHTNFFSVKKKIKTLNENELVLKAGFPSDFIDRYRDS